MTAKDSTPGASGSRARPGGSARRADQPDAGSPRAVPPSFTPQGAGPSRPPRTDDAIPAGGPRKPPRPVVPARRVPPQSLPDAGSARTPQRQRAAGRPPVAGRQSTPSRPVPAQGPARGAGPAARRTPDARTPLLPAARDAELKRRRRRVVIAAIVVVLVAMLAWPIGLLMWAGGKVQHVDALSGAANTPGTTYLLAGSDSRADGTIGDDGTKGARTDTIMLLQVPESGPAALISLPRDSYVDIPGKGKNKLNAAFAWGGPTLLVATVEKLTGMTVDRYVEIGFGGIEHVVDAVGGVELCLDYDVADANSGLNWTAGCHVSDGPTALAFARMRYSDPKGDIGRAERQQQLIGAITHKVESPSLLFQPGKQVSLITAGTGALAVSTGTGITDLGHLALDFRKATGPSGITGTPPIKNLDYRPGKVGSTVQLDPDATPAFFAAIMNGTLPAGKVGGAPGA